MTPAAMKESLPKQSLITKPREYQYVYSRGKRVRGKNVTFIYTKNELQHNRLGISINGKKLATRRNRIKRLIKEFYRLNRNFPSCLAGQDSDFTVDLVVATSKKFDPCGLNDILAAFSPFLHQTNLKRPEPAFC